jgi:outer membrane usher protein FimD/PapC
VTDSLTIGGGGEGNGDFASGGAGITLRSDTLGLVSLDLLGSHDRARSDLARGWSARYSYVTPEGSVLIGRRQFERGFRSFLTSPTAPFLRSETRVAASTTLWKATLVADWTRSDDQLERRDIAAVRMSTNLGRTVTLSAEMQGTRINGGHRDWGAYVFLRKELDDQRWVGGSLRSANGSRTIDVETGKTLLQGEGVGYRIGTTATTGAAGNSNTVYAGANWNLRPAALEFFGATPTNGGSGYAEVAVSGAVVGVDGYWGLTRQVNDSFALARLGVPQAGVEVLLNNQVQGVTDDRGMLFVPNVGAFGRQDLSINDKQVGMQYNLAERRKVIAPAYRSGTVVDFGGKKLRAVAGMAWRVTDGSREPIAARSWTVTGPSGTLTIETSSAGDFYLDDAPAGTYTGRLDAARRTYSCALTVPEFAEAVLELKEGIVCE